jgi:hypothetical protein
MHIQSNGKECQQEIITHYSHPVFSEISMKMFQVVVEGNFTHRLILSLIIKKAVHTFFNMQIQLYISGRRFGIMEKLASFGTRC